MTTDQATTEVLDEALSELEGQAQWEPTLANDEPTSQPDTTLEWWAEVKGEPTPEAAPLDDSLFDDQEPAKQTPQVTEEQKTLDRERVKQATIDNAIKKSIADDWSINEEKFATLPEWVQKEINLQFSEPEPAPQTDAKAAAREVLNEERDEAKFNELKSSLGGKLSTAQQQELAAEFKDNRSHNMTKAKALEKAMKAVWLWTQEAIERAKQIWFQRGQAAFPTNAWAPAREVPLENKDISDMNDDEVIKMVKAW